jgi:D-hexose-6-phosphate mutarotase
MVLSMPIAAARPDAFHALLNTLTVSDSLRVELIVTNKSTSEFEFENCLHTYFTAGTSRR